MTPTPFAERRFAFVDIETTGTRPTRDRITEIAVLQYDGDQPAGELVSLVDPGCSVPPSIVALTGIDDALLSGAPPIDDLLPALRKALQGRVLVAHNARFDLGFLRNALRRGGEDLRLPVICTLKLARRLYPGLPRHALDFLCRAWGIERPTAHRARADAQALPALLERMRKDHGDEALLCAMDEQSGSGALPPGISPEVMADIPDAPGVYLFYGEKDSLLYVGKSVRLRSRVRDHFAADHRDDREMRIAQQLHRVEWIETAGELGALLLEAELVKSRTPLFNRRLRRTRRVCALTWTGLAEPPRVVDLLGRESLPTRDLYGLYRNRRQARDQLATLAETHGLCPRLLGLESGRGACFSSQLGRCRGACCGRESPESHQQRLAEALAPLRLRDWPYAGPVGIEEQTPGQGLWRMHVVDRWCYLGTANTRKEAEKLARTGAGRLDLDLYRILLRFMPPDAPVVPLWDGAAG
ncbi:MAG: exonuclease domain-containing protein [Halothiobacillaceae bacterium]